MDLSILVIFTLFRGNLVENRLRLLLLTFLTNSSFLYMVALNKNLRMTRYYSKTLDFVYLMLT